MGKVQKISGWTWHKQHHEAMFIASYQQATGTYNRKTRHGMNLLKAQNKSPLQTMSKKISEDMMAPM